MAKPDFQARPGLRGGTASESPFPNGEAPRRPEDADVEDGAEGKEGEEWGFAPKGGGFSREAKIGLALILVLAVAFGFVYYQKTQQKSLLASAAKDDAPPEETPAANEKQPPKGKPVAARPAAGSPFPDEPAPAKPTSRPGRNRIPLDEFARNEPPQDAPPQTETLQNEPPPDEATDLFQPPAGAPARPVARPAQDEGNPFGDAPETAGTGHPASPVDVGDPFGEGAPPVQQGEPGMVEAIPEQGDDPFGPAPAEVAGAPREMAPAGNVPPPQDLEGEPLQDGFEPIPEDTQVTGFSDPPGRGTGGPVRSAAPAGPSPFDPPPTRAVAPGPPRSMPQPRPVTPPARGFGNRPPVGQPLEPGAEQFQKPVVSNARPAGAPADPFGAAAGSTTVTVAPETFRPTPVAGGVRAGEPRPDVYAVQPGDNFWKISSKQYGTAKYFQALANYNSDRIPDPTKLRPGMKVLTPSPDVLVARYPTLFPKTAGSEEAIAQEGLFLGPNGQPLYRVGSRDSLNTIARDHLGRSSRWIQIFEMNRDQLKTPSELKIGAVLRLPLDASSVRVVNNGGTLR